jgi:Flp pilus assembly protein TadG
MRGRAHLRRDERGQGLVEFALVLPVFLLLLIGIVEFGSVYSDVLSMRQGVREAGRQGSVANFGTAWTNDNSCLTATSPGGMTNNMKNLLCLAKSQSGVSDSVRMRVKIDDANLNPLADGAANAWTAGNAVVICAVLPIQSLTGLFQPFLNGKYAKTKAAFRIEKDSPPITVYTGGEADPTGQNWSWCS